MFLVRPKWQRKLIVFEWLFRRTHLYRVVKIDVESIARAVRKEAGVVLCQNSSESFEFNFYRVIGRSV